MPEARWRGGGLARCSSVSSAATAFSRCLHTGASFVTCAPHAAAANSASSTAAPAVSSAPRVRAFIAIGGNSGHRARNLTQALSMLQRSGRSGDLRLEATSMLYETSPVGSPAMHAHQPRFLNAVVEVSTSLAPLELLDRLQAVEHACGRVRDANGVRNGPRTVDLDLIFYRDTKFRLDEPRLQLPHPRWAQRGFVLAPLRDLLCGPDRTGQQEAWFTEAANDVREAWTSWGRAQSAPAQSSGPLVEHEEIYRVIPFPNADAVPDSPVPALSDVWRWGAPVRSEPGISAPQPSTTYPRVLPCPTHVMGILNLTPDSFSDGGAHTKSVQASVDAAKALWDAGADIIDIGGESTRPGATDVSLQEELARILPVIAAIREQHPHIKMSVDTYHPAVARAAVQAGAHMINDVCGGTIREAREGGSTESMLDVAAELNVPYVCMHIRGTVRTMTNRENNQYTNVVTEVREEQEMQLRDAFSTRATVSDSAAASSSSSSPSTAAASPSSSILYRWNLISDPGIGFAKSGTQAVTMLRDLRESRPFGGAFPILVGTSRKGFIASALRAGQQANQARQQLTTPPTSTSSPPQLPLVDRAWGTSATLTASIAGGADIIRVHDVHEARCVRDVADQIYKQ